jgi:hypothetical protein
MSFESLSTEILFEIFDYLDDIHILQIFHGLNCHFNERLLTYFRVSPQLNLQSITKSNFDIACKYFIPSITDKIRSLRLSNGDDTPEQINHFLSYGLTLYKFTNLKSLSLHSMCSEQIINRMMIEWQYPRDLTHLNIINCRVLKDWNIVYSLINNIWSLPKLTHCQLDIDSIDEYCSIVPTTTSSSLKYLSIKNLCWDLRELIHLFQHTPHLQYLDVNINDNSTNVYLPSPLLLITTLKLSYKGSFDMLRSFLKNVPNLRRLTMRTNSMCVYGDQWEEIISNYLSKLKIFHLLMEFDNRHTRVTTHALINKYRTPFWLEKHKWYIEGHCYKHRDSNVMFLYTLPYMFERYSIPYGFYSTMGSTFPKCIDHISYGHVHHSSPYRVPDSDYQFRHSFYHTRHLVIGLPFSDNFWPFTPTFDGLRVLQVSLCYEKAYNKAALFQLQSFLERAPKLYSLIIKSSIDLLLPLLESISESLVKLDLQHCDGYFNHSNCATLFLSSLGKQCRILSIKIEDRTNILQLIKEMPQLQTLNVEYPSNICQTDERLSHNDHLIQWLQHKLPSTCIITRDSISLNKTHIWIR